MRSPIKRFVTLALFAQLLVVISAKRSGHGKGNKLRTISQHNGKSNLIHRNDNDVAAMEETFHFDKHVVDEDEHFEVEPEPEPEDDYPEIIITPEHDDPNIIVTPEEEDDPNVIVTPEDDDPVNDEPGKDEPGNDEPGKDEPGNDEPGNDEPGKDEPGNDEPGKDEPGNDEPGKDEPGKDEPGKGCTSDSCYCDNIYDVVLVMETSSFAGYDNWFATFHPFVKNLASKFKIASDKVHMAILFFASFPEEYVSFQDEESQDKKKLLAKIDEISEIGKYHNVLYCDALYYALEDMLFNDGARDGVGKVSILFTYGYDNDNNKALIPDLVETYKEEGVKLLAVGMDIGENENIYSLAGCANNDLNCPNGFITIYNDIYAAPRDVKTRICKKGQDN